MDNNFTIYANPYTVVRKNQCTKHFFLGSQRILTKISSSDVPQTFFEGYAENIVPNVDYESKQDDLESNLLLNNKELNIGWYRETRGRIPSQHIKHYLRSKEYGGLSGVNPWQDGTETTDKTATYEEKQYFFHPDHLGSSNYLTDVLGEAYQHIEYLPWGEVFVEERNTQTSRNTFLYTGKELDEETGLYYYEQRYYDPNKSTFLGVDPLLDSPEQVGFSTYCYVANNPIIYIDPDGMKKLKYSGRLGLTSGKLGITATIFGVGFSVEIDFGSFGRYYSVFIELDTETGETNLGLTYEVETSDGGVNEVTVGYISGGKKEYTKTVNEINILEGIVPEKTEKIKEENASLGPFIYSEKKIDDKYIKENQIESKVDVKVNALIIGVEANIKQEVIEEVK